MNLQFDKVAFNKNAVPLSGIAWDDMSLAMKVRALPDSLRQAELMKMVEELGCSDLEELAKALLGDWTFWARPKQLHPPGDWGTWLLLAGRGFGKTTTGAHWVHERAMVDGKNKRRWIALVARTPADARDYMIEGPSGLLRCGPPHERPQYEPSKKRLTWPNGSWATIYSDDEPDQVRGFSGDTAWLDEFAKFKNPRLVWDNLQFGMREISEDKPRRLITTTPRPIPVLKEIAALPSTTIVHGTSYENKVNLDPSWYADTILPYEGTRTGRQEISGEIIDDIPNALWTNAILDKCRVLNEDELPDMQRVVIAIDPSGTKGQSDDGDEVGIVAAGKGVDGCAYILGDYTCKLPPSGWGRRAIEAYTRHEADVIVAEKNFGGAMVAHVIRSINPDVSFKEVVASRGKVVRAEPVAALYAQEKVLHYGTQAKFAALESQMLLMSTSGYEGESSPDRLDAAVWAVTELMLAPRAPRYVTTSTRVRGLT